MIYHGYSQHELNKITAILDKHEIEYQLSAPNADDAKKIARDSSVLAIEISDEELAKVPADDLHKLHDLRIYGEMPNPFEAEDYEDKPIEKRPVKQQSKWGQVLIGVTMFLLVLMYLYKSLRIH